MESFEVGAETLSPEAVVAVARHGAGVRLAAGALERIRHGREVIESLADDSEPHYGISTGFGALATRFIPPDRRRQLQVSLIRSHAAGSGPEVEREVVRGLMLLRLATMATGHTGVREETAAAYAADLQDLRPHPGQAASAANLRALLDGSGIMASHRGPDCTRVQDAYSLRCAPQVAGAARDTVTHAAAVAARELASAIDNPVVTDDGRVESNGNFHGAPVGYVLDFLAIVTADVASMSERRTDRFLDKSRNSGLNAF